jgi:UPF0716 protein FxsA
MLFKLFLAFALIPMAEIYVLLTVGAAVGPLKTLAMVVLTALAGAHLARTQGLQAMMAVRAKLDAGEVPAEEMIDALIIFLAGVVLLTPGFLTDAAGLLMLYPSTRYRFKQWLRTRFDDWARNPDVTIRRFP